MLLHKCFFTKLWPHIIPGFHCFLDKCLGEIFDALSFLTDLKHQLIRSIKNLDKLFKYGLMVNNLVEKQNGNQTKHIEACL